LTDTDKQKRFRKLSKLNNATQNSTKQNYPDSVAYYNTKPGNDLGSFIT